MSSYHDTVRRPAQGFEVIEDVVALVQGIATLTAAIGGTAYIYAHRAPEPVGTHWKRIVVRQPFFGQGNRTNIARTTGFRFDIMVEVQEQVERPDQFLAQSHDLIFEALVDQSLTLSRGQALGKIQPYTDPTAAAYDAEDHSYYSTAGYVLALTHI